MSVATEGETIQPYCTLICSVQMTLFALLIRQRQEKELHGERRDPDTEKAIRDRSSDKE